MLVAIEAVKVEVERKKEVMGVLGEIGIQGDSMWRDSMDIERESVGGGKESYQQPVGGLKGAWRERC